MTKYGSMQMKSTTANQMNRSKEYSANKISLRGSADSARVVAAEIPVSLTYNGVAHVVMMLSPTDLEDFALGFSLTEQIISNPDELLSCEARQVDQGYVVNCEIPKEGFVHLIEGRRNMVGQTGCGICGVVELEHAIRKLPELTSQTKANKAAIFTALETLEPLQSLNTETGAVHGAALVGAQGDILALREDVGRHNAFDKLIGHAARENLAHETGFVLLTSRCSHELVQKAVVFGVPMLVSISAPTTLAIELATCSGLTLVALARSDNVLCFNDPHGIFAET